MRELKFRGKSLDGKFIYTGHDCMFSFTGDFAYYPGRGEGAAIVPLQKGTVGQYTGLKDKNGVEIYEGDIVTGEWEWQSPGVVRFGWSPDNEETNSVFGWLRDDHALSDFGEVIGNIYDNSELLKSGNE